MHQFLEFIFGIKLCMFRTVPLSNITSFSLYTQNGRPDPVRKLAADLYYIYHRCV